MIGNLRPASDEEIAHLLAHPAEIARFLYGAGADDREKVVLDRAWHAIHFALTGSRLGGEAPLNFLVAEGTPIGEVDVGFGPARVLTSEQVRHIAAALAPLQPEDVGRRINLSKLDQERIYPGNWRTNGFDIGDVIASYRDMRHFVQRAAERGQGLVLYIN